MTRQLCLAALTLLLLHFAVSQELLQRQERRARQQKALKQIPGCDWQLSECNPKKGRCGKGFQTATLTGSGCPSKTKKVRCKIPCREEVRGPITGLSPSEAGLRGEAVSSSVSTINSNNKNRKNKDQKCRYSKGDWSPCNPETQKITRTLTLKRGDASVCPPTKEIVKKCRKECKYGKGAWSECNPITGYKTRTATLKKGDTSKCKPTKTVSRRCKKGQAGQEEEEEQGWKSQRL
ncbi:pleiotrophin-like [Liolophura sinensis]|uniref:pleiotrophin-like n=1 Tax=Liolophura sinensis TaxID=3198878 RepID=UPI003158F4FB